MAAGLGFKNFVSGDVLTAADTNGYLMQGVWVFANAAARTAAVTSPQEGNASFLKDTNSLEIYDGAAWVAYGAGDITGVVAGTGLSGGGTTGSVTLTNTVATAFDAKGDLVAGTGADAFSRLAVGANDTVLTADSSTATGLKWAAAPTSSANFSLVNAGGTALTGATTITVSGITGADKLLILVQTASSANASSIFTIRFNGNTGSVYSNTGIALSAPNTYASSILADLSSLSTSSFAFARMSANAGSEASGYIYLTGGNTSGIKAVQIAGAGDPSSSDTQLGYVSGGIFNSTDTISSVSIISSSGNFDNGFIYVYKSA